MSKRRSAITVSDHAVLRWLERVGRIDIAALRNQIARSAEVAVAHGAVVVVIHGGKIVLDSTRSRVVTVLHRDQDHHGLLAPVEIEAPIVARRLAKRGRR